jgi:nucleoside 2-deoxyribosyltransferase
MIYLACPYRHIDSKVAEKRLQTSCLVAALLMKHGFIVFNPLSHSVPIESKLLEEFEFESDNEVHDFWMRQDLEILRKCTAVVLIEIDGWEQSKGVKKELEESQNLNIPIYRITEDDIEHFRITLKIFDSLLGTQNKINIKL